MALFVIFVYSFRSTEYGNRLNFKGVNHFGVVVVEGIGMINGLNVQLQIRYFDGFVYDEAMANMQVFPDSRRMQGVVQYTRSGSRQMLLVRQY